MHVYYTLKHACIEIACECKLLMYSIFNMKILKQVVINTVQN